MTNGDPGGPRHGSAADERTGDTERAFAQALSLHRRGQLNDARAIYQKILARVPNHFGALQLLGVSEFERGHHAEAERLLDQALSVNPVSAAAHFNRGNVLFAQQRLTEALSSYDRGIELDPNDPDMHSNRGIVLHALRRLDEALASYDRALAINPKYQQALVNRGIALHALKRNNIALESYERALAIAPNNIEALFNRGFVLEALSRYEEALASYDRALAFNPNLAEAWVGRGNIFRSQKRYDDALAAFDRALAIKRDVPGALLGRGNALIDLGRYQDALAAYDRALAVQPGLVEAWNGRGNALHDLRRIDEATVAYDKALLIDINFVEAWLGRGNVLTSLGRGKDALEAYDRALEIKPDLAAAWHGRAMAFVKLSSFQKAIECEDRALALRPDYAEAYANRATALKELSQFHEVIETCEKALALKPNLKYVAGLRLSTKLDICDWSNIEIESAQIKNMIGRGVAASVPFMMLSTSSSAADQLKCAQLYVADNFPPNLDQCCCVRRYQHNRIRLAYLSSDFCEHATAFLAAGMFEQHDRSQFETTAVSLVPDVPGPMNDRLRKAFDRYINVSERTDGEIAEMLRQLEIDIAVDLKGYTKDARTGILAARAAPIQVNYLGYPGSMGAEFIDYIIADRTVIEETDEKNYSEAIAYLPDTYQVNDSQRRVSDNTPSRSNIGLPSDGFIFCCFNNNYKLNPDVFEIWMRLLRKVKDSQLWLLEGNPFVRRNLEIEATKRGISPERLIFAPRVNVEDHLARHKLADLFLDTIPYNAHTTASDALWTGLPIVTCRGTTFAGRVAASLLHSVGLPELVCNSLDEYEALALKLANTPEMLTLIKEKLVRNRTRYPLFNTRLFTRHIECAFKTMWERHQQGLQPASFAVKAIDCAYEQPYGPN